jgi:predicted DNA-binding transcriptional regulator AlpA
MPNLLRAKEVAKKRGRSTIQLYVDIAEGKFPPGIKLSPKVVVWKESVVDAEIEKELAQAALGETK